MSDIEFGIEYAGAKATIAVTDSALPGMVVTEDGATVQLTVAMCNQFESVPVVVMGTAKIPFETITGNGGIAKDDRQKAGFAAARAGAILAVRQAIARAKTTFPIMCPDGCGEKVGPAAEPLQDEPSITKEPFTTKQVLEEPTTIAGMEFGGKVIDVYQCEAKGSYRLYFGCASKRQDWVTLLAEISAAVAGQKTVQKLVQKTRFEKVLDGQEQFGLRSTVTTDPDGRPAMELTFDPDLVADAMISRIRDFTIRDTVLRAPDGTLTVADVTVAQIAESNDMDPGDAAAIRQLLRDDTRVRNRVGELMRLAAAL